MIPLTTSTPVTASEAIATKLAITSRIFSNLALFVTSADPENKTIDVSSRRPDYLCYINL